MEYVNCPVCGNSDSVLLFRRPDHTYRITDNLFSIVRCSNCSMAYVNPRPTRTEMSDYYPVGFYNTDLGKEELLRQQSRQLEQKWEYVKHLKPGRLLDVGCQKGEFMYYMSNKGWTADGMDVSVKPTNPFKMNIKNCELVDCNYKDEDYDLITLWAVLEHVHDPVEMMLEVYRLLKSGGKVLILVTNMRSIPGRFMQHDDVPRHLLMFSPRSLRILAQKSRLKVDLLTYNNELFGGRHRGFLNYCIKRLWGERIEDIVAQNRSSGRWAEFSGCLNGKPSVLVSKIDRIDEKIMPLQDKLMDKLGYGFIMIASLSKA